MSLTTFPSYDCGNESDVEQKFLYPLLTHPSFLDIRGKAILTKRSLGVMQFVSKTTLPKNYVPDYVVFFSGFPTCVIEAKEPEVPVEQALAEARLYASVLNANFPPHTNPVLNVVGCNGREFAFGSWDSNEHKKYSVSELLVGSEALGQVREALGAVALNQHASKIQRALSKTDFVPPSRYVDGQMFVDRVRPNALAPYLNPIYEMFFRGEDPEKIQLILERAYVDTAELREYDQVLHAMLRQIERTQYGNYQTIQTDRTHEYTLTPEITRYESEPDARGRLHLIVGSRGSGKSLFIARFFSYLIPDSLKQRAVWFTLDFNLAPSSIENIEDYICEKFIECAQNIGFDPYHIDGLNRIFSVELSRLRKGALSVVRDEHEQQRLLAAELLRLSADKKNFALRLARHITGEANRPLIVAFDNVDRRESDQQLRIFQAAQWFRSETRAFSLLTLRDTTFERFKNEPPLDAFAQISNFYVRPPRFSLVLQKRLILAVDEGLKDISEVEQVSSGGARFKYTKDQLGTYLRTVYAALFHNEHQVGRVVDALAERDVREALGMFARILASGHFDADKLIGIGMGGEATISHELLIKILMRADYRIYSEDAGFIHNIFWTPRNGFGGNIFLAPEILGLLGEEGETGTDKLAGYWRLEEIIADLASMGFEEPEIREGVQYLFRKKLAISDGENSDTLGDSALIKITPSGFIHLRTLPHFIEYLSSVALHCSLGDQRVARRIGEIWSRASNRGDLYLINKSEVASIFSEYLVREKNRLDAQNPLFKERSRVAESLVKAITHTVNLSKRSGPRGTPSVRRQHVRARPIKRLPKA